jgi:hypothetical protein
MPHVDPTVRFWIGVAVTLAMAVSSGTLVLTNAVPHDLIPTVTAWCGIIGTVGSAVLTALNGAAMTTSSRIASAAAVDGVKGITVTRDIAATAVEAAGGNAAVTTVPPAKV